MISVTQNNLLDDIAAMTLVRQAGLEQAAMQFGEDVAVAMKTAAQARVALAMLAPADSTNEPWPPMRVRGAV